MVVMPDVNTLVAAAWPNHIHHRLARRWLLGVSTGKWATCPLVQSSFLRISMNRHVVGEDIRFGDALGLLDRYTSNDNHLRWEHVPMPQDWPRYLVQRVQGYRQVTDATLLATVIHHDGVLATLDAGILNLLPAAEAYRVHLIVP